jgi:hypothetical protein
MAGHLKAKFPQVADDELQRRISEFFKFIYLQSMKDSGFIPVTKEVDDIWHEYILQTRDYAVLCQDLPSKQFVHHQTISLEQYVGRVNRVEAIKTMLAWVPNYRTHFGDFTELNAPYWLIVVFLSNEMNFTLEQINKIGC